MTIRYLDNGIKVIERDNYVLANTEANSYQYALVSSTYALNLLECFGNLLLSLNKLLVENNCISKELESEVCNFGFIASSIDEWGYGIDKSDNMRFYLINYLAFLKNARKKHDVSSQFKRMTINNDLLNEMKSKQAFNFALRCAVGCIVDRFADRMSRAWMDWHNVVWAVADKYFFELQKYEILIYSHRNIQHRQQTFERYAKLPMKWEVNRQHAILEEAALKSKNEAWTEKMLEKWNAGDNQI